MSEQSSRSALNRYDKQEQELRRSGLSDERSSGRTLGILLLIQMAAGLVLPFVLLRPVIVDIQMEPQVRQRFRTIRRLINLPFPNVQRRSEHMQPLENVICIPSHQVVLLFTSIKGVHWRKRINGCRLDKQMAALD